MNSRISTNQETLLRASEVALRLNISRAFVYQLMQTGELPTVHLGRSVRVRPSDLEELIRSNTFRGNSK
jgi:excisionase family DNA binding protein